MDIVILVYLGLCVAAGYLGRRRALGFFGFFVLSVVVTPLLTIVILILTAPRRSVAAGK
jgi:Sec-independent protein secretion pathway component TatC